MESCVRDIGAKFDGTLSWQGRCISERKPRAQCSGQIGFVLIVRSRAAALGSISRVLELDACQCQGKAEGGALAIIGTPGIYAAVELAGANNTATLSR